MMLKLTLVTLHEEAIAKEILKGQKKYSDVGVPTWVYG
jgi:hypothetical protein